MGEAEGGGQTEVGEVGLADAGQDEAEDGPEAGEVGGPPGEAGGEDEVGQAGEGGQAEDGPPVVRTDLLQVEPLTVTQSHSVSV